MSTETFVDLFCEQARRTPEAVGAMAGGGSATYADLHRRSSLVAAGLLARGVQPEAVVGVLANRGLELLVCLLGILKAGAAYLPLAVDHPPFRTVQVLQQARCRVVVSSRDHAGLVRAALERLAPERSCSLLHVEELGRPRAVTLAHDLRPRPENLAYALFTSGSTGRPKGAMIEHRGLLNHLLAKIRELDLSSADRVVQSAPQTFDVSIWQFLAALLTGGQVLVVGDERADRPWSLLTDVAGGSATVLEVVPAMLGAVLDWLDREAGELTLPDLRWLVVTGEALPWPLARRWLRRFPRVPLVNAYGPTECSDDVTHHVVTASLPASGSVPIGHALEGVRLYVLDPDGSFRPCRPGAAGELHVGGVCVGRGYLNDPGRTAGAFVPDPISGVHGERLYRTGDLVRIGVDGALEFVGRADHQVKIRGRRIELGDIEASLMEHEDISAAAVVVRDHSRMGRSLVAYLVPRAVAPAADDLRRHLFERLPAYMVPARFVSLRALPLTASGKVDRRRLPDILDGEVRLP